MMILAQTSAGAAASVAGISRKADVRDHVAHLLQRHQTRVVTAAAPSQRGEAFADVPLLALPLQGELALYEPELLAEFADYSLAGLPAELPDFARVDTVRPYLIDIEVPRDSEVTPWTFIHPAKP